MVIVATLVKGTETTISTAEAYKSGLVAASTSDSTKMVIMGLATSSTSPVMVVYKWVKSILKMTGRATEALNTRRTEMLKSLIIDYSFK